ncbi:MAG: PQQ-binding-like beta-propeller repeat protein [Bacteroidetes bacterium]|nr:PQQ-binding-like beta-propeller repeat protein [Bacteroidota bacterium]
MIFRTFPLFLFVLLTGCNTFLVNLESDHRVLPPVNLPLHIDWKYNARAGFGPDPPLIVGNNIIVSTRRGEVHVIAVDSGKRLARKNFGDAINGSVALIDSTLVIPLAKGRRMLLAYDVQRGEMQWRIRGAPIEVGITPLDDGGLFVTTDGMINRFMIADGEIVWQYGLSPQQRVYARPIVHNHSVIIAVDNGEVIALSLSDGSLQWILDIGSPIYATPQSNNELLIVSTTQGRLVAVDINERNIRWDITFHDNTLRLSTAAIDDKLIAIGGSDGILRVIELETGEIQWETQCSDALVAQPIITDTVIYTASMGHLFYAFDRQTGEELQAIELRGRVKSSIGVSDGGLILLSEPRDVIKLSTLHSEHEI